MKKIDQHRLISCRRGIFAMELVIALVLALALLMAMTAAVSKVRRAERQLTEVRAATRRMETALLDLQSGGSAPEGVMVERIAEPGSPAPAGMTWVKVSIKPEGLATKAAQSLVGLVPENRAPRSAGGGQP